MKQGRNCIFWAAAIRLCPYKSVVVGAKDYIGITWAVAPAHPGVPGVGRLPSRMKPQRRPAAPGSP